MDTVEVIKDKYSAEYLEDLLTPIKNNEESDKVEKITLPPSQHILQISSLEFRKKTTISMSSEVVFQSSLAKPENEKEKDPYSGISPLKADNSSNIDVSNNIYKEKTLLHSSSSSSVQNLCRVSSRVPVVRSKSSNDVKSSFSSHKFTLDEDKNKDFGEIYSTFIPPSFDTVDLDEKEKNKNIEGDDNRENDKNNNPINALNNNTCFNNKTGNNIDLDKNDKEKEKENVENKENIVLKCTTTYDYDFLPPITTTSSPSSTPLEDNNLEGKVLFSDKEAIKSEDIVIGGGNVSKLNDVIKGETPMEENELLTSRSDRLDEMVTPLLSNTTLRVAILPDLTSSSNLDPFLPIPKGAGEDSKNENVVKNDSADSAADTTINNITANVTDNGTDISSIVLSEHLVNTPEKSPKHLSSSPELKAPISPLKVPSKNSSFSLLPLSSTSSPDNNLGNTNSFSTQHSKVAKMIVTVNNCGRSELFRVKSSPGEKDGKANNNDTNHQGNSKNTDNSKKDNNNCNNNNNDKDFAVFSTRKNSTGISTIDGTNEDNINFDNNNGSRHKKKRLNIVVNVNVRGSKSGTEQKAIGFEIPDGNKTDKISITSRNYGGSSNKAEIVGGDCKINKSHISCNETTDINAVKNGSNVTNGESLKVSTPSDNFTGNSNSSICSNINGSLAEDKRISADDNDELIIKVEGKSVGFDKFLSSRDAPTVNSKELEKIITVDNNIVDKNNDIRTISFITGIKDVNNKQLTPVSVHEDEKLKIHSKSEKERFGSNDDDKEFFIKLSALGVFSYLILYTYNMFAKNK